MVQWTYSAMKLFRTCPRQYYHAYVLKDIKPSFDPISTAYGTQVHEAIEKYIKSDALFPPEYNRFKPTVDEVKTWRGEQHVEYKMALGPDFEPVSFWDKGYFVRGVADFLNVDGTKARVIDWKTGKNAKYADPKQLELMALMTFKHFPQVEAVRGGLAFLVPDVMVPKGGQIYKKEDEKKMWEGWLYDVKRIEIATEKNVFNPSPSGLCRKHCNILTCEHNGKR
jgi:hypothetical protein